MDGRTEIRAKLLLDPSVTDLVGEYESLPAIFDSPLVPEKYLDPAISMYLTTPVDGGLNYGSYNNTVNCFSKTYKEAQSIQDAVYQALNRKSYDGSFFRCSKQVIIPPQETGGDYNAPVEVLVRSEI
jgi:hypothetical protein